MKKRKRLLGILISTILLFVFGGINTCAEENSEEWKIGVVVYDPENPEMEMFLNYYRDYIEEGFPVKFYFSDAVSSAEEENDFILQAKENGVQGIISFYGQDLQNTVKLCEENEIYYVMGSGTVSDAEFDAVKENSWFLGTIGPDPALEYQAGYDMASYFAETEAKSYVIMTGGSMKGNFMHSSRVRGMLDALKEKAGLVVEDVEKAAASEENTILSSEDGQVQAVLVPDYTTGNGLENLKTALVENNCDALMSSFYVYDFMDQIEAQEEKQNQDILVGTIDSFTEDNFELMKTKDAFRNDPINYIEGKYASMAGPGFAVMVNAITGHAEVNDAEKGSVRLYQGFWKAETRKEFLELYGYTTGIYENAYSCEDLMQVMKVYNEDTTQEDLKALTEAYTVEDVKERILKD